MCRNPPSGGKWSNVSASISELRREVADETQDGYMYGLPTSTFDSISTGLSSLIHPLHWLEPFFRFLDRAASFISKAHAFWWVIKAVAGLYRTLAMPCVMPRERVGQLYRRRWRRARNRMRNTLRGRPHTSEDSEIYTDMERLTPKHRRYMAKRAALLEQARETLQKQIRLDRAAFKQKQEPEPKKQKKKSTPTPSKPSKDTNRSSISPSASVQMRKTSGRRRAGGSGVSGGAVSQHASRGHEAFELLPAGDTTPPRDTETEGESML